MMSRDAAASHESAAMAADEIDGLARVIVQHGWVAPSLLLIELLRPLSFVVSQAALMLGPALAWPGRGSALLRFARRMEDRRSLDLLAGRVETLWRESAHASEEGACTPSPK